MTERNGRWIAALILLVLLLAVVVLFGTVDLGFAEYTLTDGSIAPILSGDGSDAAEKSIRLPPKDMVLSETSPPPAD